MTRTHLRRLGLLALASVTLIPTGCLWVAVGAGAAAGCAAGYAYMKGEVPQTYVASFDDTWSAAQTSLGELGMPVISAEKTTSTSGTIRTRLGKGEVVAIQIDEEPSVFPADGPVTRVGVRVAVLGDYPVSDRILTQIGAHLTPPGAAARAPSGGIVPARSVAPQNTTVTPASWTGVPSVTPPPPPRPAAAGTTPPPPASSTPAAILPASTPPPPLATPEPPTR
jgi:hypothetical protein